MKAADVIAKGGFPSNKERNSWAQEDWDVWNEHQDRGIAERDAAANKAYEESGERLKERLDALEERIRKLEG